MTTASSSTTCTAQPIGPASRKSQSAWAAGWYTFEELDAISMQAEIRNSILVAYGLKDAPNTRRADPPGDGRLDGRSRRPSSHRPERHHSFLTNVRKRARRQAIRLWMRCDEEPITTTPAADVPFARPVHANRSTEARTRAYQGRHGTRGRGARASGRGRRTFDEEDGSEGLHTSLASIADAIPRSPARFT